MCVCVCVTGRVGCCHGYQTSFGSPFVITWDISCVCAVARAVDKEQSEDSTTHIHASLMNLCAVSSRGSSPGESSFFFQH